ncbi:MAG: hypothetical protein ACFFEE_11330 [Candidatus Thorarchaeota archaeon]
MEIDIEIIYELLATDQTKKLESLIAKVLKTEIQSKKDWEEFVTILQVGCQENYQSHLLKTHHMILSIFGMPELIGVDCNLFKELREIPPPSSIEEASKGLFDALIEISKKQLKTGGSTLFFDIEKISSTRSAVITSDLIEARHRETILVLKEIDDILPTLTKEWVDVSRLWRTGNGFRFMKATDLGLVIHVKEYEDIRNLLLKEMKIESEKLSKASREFGEANYLQLSKTLDEFVTGLIKSKGIRGTYEPHFKAWIDHEGLDEF